MWANREILVGVQSLISSACVTSRDEQVAQCVRSNYAANGVFLFVVQIQESCLKMREHA